MSSSPPDRALPFDLQPTLRGSLVELRPLVGGDWEPLLAAASDPLIWEQHPESNRHEPAVFRRYFDGALASRGAFAVVDRVSGLLIGSTRYCNLDRVGREVEIGWTFLERRYWGGAYNGEMKSLLVNHAFRFVDRVVFVVGEHNRRSQRALEKIGATRIREERRPGPDGRLATFLVFAIHRPPAALSGTS